MRPASNSWVEECVLESNFTTLSHVHYVDIVLGAGDKAVTKMDVVPTTL